MCAAEKSTLKEGRETRVVHARFRNVCTDILSDLAGANDNPNLHQSEYLSLEKLETFFTGEPIFIFHGSGICAFC